MEQYQQVAAPSTFTRVFSFIGLIAVLILGMWGAVKLAQIVPGGLNSTGSAISGFFAPSRNTITVSASALTVSSGNPLDISFTHSDTSVAGTYAFRYSCTPGVSVTTRTNGEQAVVACNTQFRFLTEGGVTVQPTSSIQTASNVEFFIDFIPYGSNGPSVTGSTVVTVLGGVAVVQPPVVTAPPTYRPPHTVYHPPTTITYPIYGTSTVSNPNGYVDLTARVIEVGTVDRTTGAFTASSTPNRYSRVAVRFAIENYGTKRSNEFAFNVVLPTLPSHIFSAPMQSQLNPGERIEYTIGFDSFGTADDGEIIFNVDPTNSINEPNKTNNIVKYTIRTVK